MKKILVSILLLSVSTFGFSQTNRTAYVDIFHILKKSPEYTEGTLELEKRAKDWQNQINTKKNEITKMKDALSIERALLTQQLIDEKEDEIKMVESELNTLQVDKFGVDGDYFKQKETIYKPILDQIHTISNDIALKKRMEIVLIKGEDNTMIYANKRNDITDLVLKEMERSRTRGKMSKKEIAAAETQDKIEESKDRQRDKRDLLRERQKQLEAGNLLTSSTDETSFENKPPEIVETEAEKRIRQNNEKIADIKKKQQEIREAQLKKIEEQKLAIKKKQEEQKLAREKALKDRLDKINNINQNKSASSSNNNTKQLTQKQEEMLAQRKQKAKEAEAKRQKVLEERKIAMAKRKKEADEAKALRLKAMQEKKEQRLKEVEELKNQK